MKLISVHIKNFRSIKDINVEFDPTCRVLVGINESGKTNILNALALLGKDFPIDRQNNKREELPIEPPITESYVKFIFRFEKEELGILLESVSFKIASNTKNPKIATDGEKNYTLKQLCDECGVVHYLVNILKESRSFESPSPDSRYKLLNGWKKRTKLCPIGFNVISNGQNIILSEYQLIRSEDFQDIPENYLEDADINDFLSLMKNSISEISTGHLPKALYWKYEEKNLLPNSINITQFANNPDLCMPLKNMFTLAGIEDIKKSITEKSGESNNQIQNYYDKIAKNTTNHFKNIWKEYDSIEFSLRRNGDLIIPGIKEKNTYDFMRRSDGFKRFVTFLLLISVNVKTKNISNSLILIDEPDSSLHPTGARYLMDELIRISKTNYVVYATHSIFMIDSREISRHYIVSKNDEITTIKTAEKSNITDEEVLFNALGYSVFSILKEKNIIFEGWRDKRLFQIYLENSSEKIKENFKNIGSCHAQGASDIKDITPIIELAKRKCFILSDSDNRAKQEQKKYKQMKGYGIWKIYQEVDNSIQAITGEDFIKNDYINKQIQSVLSGNSSSISSQIVLPEKKEKLAAIQKWLKDKGMKDDQAKDKINEIKELIFDNLTYEFIEEEYEKLFSKLPLLFGL